MKYAVVEGQRQEAQPGRTGICPACKSPVVAKCGNVRVGHWAHRGKRDCDTWSENETEWHRNWKDQFPVDWQEVFHPAENGEWHRADVKTDQGWVLEFQHSRIHPEERKARELFYPKLVWIVHGWQKRDKPQFSRALAEGRIVAEKVNLFRIPFPDECGLLRDWTGSNASVFFDFSEDGKPQDPQLWYLIRVVSGMAYVLPFSREDFLKYHGSEAKNFMEILGKLHEIVELVNQPPKAVSVDPMALLSKRRLMARRGRL
jgi:competence protein CoiA